MRFHCCIHSQSRHCIRTGSVCRYPLPLPGYIVRRVPACGKLYLRIAVEIENNSALLFSRKSVRKASLCTDTKEVTWGKGRRKTLGAEEVDIFLAVFVSGGISSLGGAWGTRDSVSRLRDFPFGSPWLRGNVCYIYSTNCQTQCYPIYTNPVSNFLLATLLLYFAFHRYWTFSATILGLHWRLSSQLHLVQFVNYLEHN